MLGLREGQLAPQPRQNDGLGFGIGETRSSTIWALGRSVLALLAATNKLLLCDQSGELIANLTGEFLQIDQRASSSQLSLMLPRQRLCYVLDPVL